MKIKTDIHPSSGQISILNKIINSLIGHDEVNVIFEFGSRYGEDTIEFAKNFPKASIYSFECNPKTLQQLKVNIKPYSNITFNECAISDQNEVIEFFQIDEAKTKTTWTDGNQGASSIFKASGNYPVEEYHQTLIKVDAITLQSFLIKNSIPEIDVLWMDIQGAELKALKGLKEKISKVKIIHLEVEFIEIYKNQPLFKNIDKFLTANNFTLGGFTSKTHYSGDAVYLNKNYFSSEALGELVNVFPKETNSTQKYLSSLFFNVKYYLFKLRNLILNK
jgi:FkbM family methyltransferase